MDEKTKRLMIEYRLEKAHTDLNAAKMNFDAGFYDTSANRSYYAIFHAARTVLMLNGQDYKKHSGVIAFFNRDFIKTEILERKLGKILRDAFEIRTDCDYEDFYVVAKEDVEQQIKNAEYFIAKIEAYLQTVFPNH